MALVNTPTAKLDITWRDASGSIGHTIIHVPFDTLAAVAVTAAGLIADAMVLLSDAVVIGYSLTYSYFDDVPAVPVAGSRVEEKGQFTWRLANGRTTGFTIPAIKDTLLNTSGSINKANALVISLVGVVAGVDAIFAGADGSTITSLLRAYQRFNGSTKAQLPGDR